MMLKVQSGAMATGDGFAPTGASQWLRLSPARSSSSEIVGQGSSRVSKISRVVASRNSSLAAQSAIIAARLAGVEEGARGATTTPARRAPTKTARYSIDAAAQTATALCGAILSALQTRRDAIDERVEFAIGDASAVVDEAEARRRFPCGRSDGFSDGGEIRQGRRVRRHLVSPRNWVGRAPEVVSGHQTSSHSLRTADAASSVAGAPS